MATLDDTRLAAAQAVKAAVQAVTTYHQQCEPEAKEYKSACLALSDCLMAADAMVHAVHHGLGKPPPTRTPWQPPRIRDTGT